MPSYTNPPVRLDKRIAHPQDCRPIRNPIGSYKMGAKTTRQIAAFACNTGYDDIPPEVTDYAKTLALSHLGQNMAGSTMEFGRIVTGYIKAKSAREEAGVFGAGYRTSADYAALANGNSAHAVELEDKSGGITVYSVGHWPTVFAMGEKLNASGKDVLGQVLGRVALPTGGSIKIDGRDFYQLPESQLGARTAYVGQETYLFPLSVRDNLLFGLKHRPIRPATYDEAMQRIREDFFRESTRAGNPPYDPNADWVDYELAGATGAPADENRGGTAACVRTTHGKQVGRGRQPLRVGERRRAGHDRRARGAGLDLREPQGRERAGAPLRG